MKSKLRSLVTLSLICGMFGFVTSKNVQIKAGEVWLGITYVLSKNGASAEATLAVGAIGAADAALWGFAVGCVATPVAGAVAGIVVSF